MDERVQPDPAAVATAIPPDYALGGHTATVGLCLLPPGTFAGIPEVLRHATISIEDKHFWTHGALDYPGIARAALKDALAGGKPVQGASTITQQLVRNLYIQNHEQTLERKITEAKLAEELFEKHDRDWILTQYLNTAPYGTV